MGPSVATGDPDDAVLADLTEAQLASLLPEIQAVLLRRVAESPRARPHLAVVLKSRLALPPLAPTGADRRLERLSLLPLPRIHDAARRAAAAWHGAGIRRVIDGVALARLVQRLGPAAHRFALRHPELHHAPEPTADAERLGGLVADAAEDFLALMLGALPAPFAHRLAPRLARPLPAPDAWPKGLRDHALRCLAVAADEVLDEGP